VLLKHFPLNQTSKKDFNILNSWKFWLLALLPSECKKKKKCKAFLGKEFLKRRMFNFSLLPDKPICTRFFRLVNVIQMSYKCAGDWREISKLFFRLFCFLGFGAFTPKS
jgi:hypothetical protein